MSFTNDSDFMNVIDGEGFEPVAENPTREMIEEELRLACERKTIAQAEYDSAKRIYFPLDDQLKQRGELPKGELDDLQKASVVFEEAKHNLGQAKECVSRLLDWLSAMKK